MRKTQALLLVVFLLILVTFLSGSLSAMLRSEANLQGKSKQSFIAFNLAQAGAERALFHLSLNTGLLEISEEVNGEFTLGNHSVLYHIAPPDERPRGKEENNYYTVIGTGRVLNANNEIMAQRMVQAQAVLHYDKDGDFDYMKRTIFGWKEL